jgi:hypothetical protein
VAAPQEQRVALRGRVIAALRAESASQADVKGGRSLATGGRSLGTILARRHFEKSALTHEAAVVGSIVFFTSVIFVAGKPLTSAYLRMMASPWRDKYRRSCRQRRSFPPIECRDAGDALHSIGRGVPELLPLKRANFGNVSRNDERAKRHRVLRHFGAYHEKARRRFARRSLHQEVHFCGVAATTPRAP